MALSNFDRWLILAAGFLALFLQYGTIKSLGLLLTPITADLDLTTSYIGFCIGMVSGLSLCLSVLTIPLLKRFPARYLVMLGGAIDAVSIMLAAASPNGLLFGLFLSLSGVGNSLYTPIVMVIPNTYFPQSFNLTMAVLLLGPSVGIMVLPVTTELLTRMYGWRWALALLGALSLNILVAGALLKGESPEEEAAAAGTSQNGLDSEHQRLITDTQSCQDDRAIRKSEADIHSDSSFIRNGHLKKVSFSCYSKLGRQNGLNSDHQRLIMDTQPCQSDRTSVTIQDSDADIHTDSSSIGSGCHKNASSSCCSKLVGILVRTFDLHVFKSTPSFIAIFIINFLCAISYCCWIVFLIPNAESKGFDPDQASLLALINGATNGVGRISVGLIMWWKKDADPFSLFCFFSLTTTIASLGNAFAIRFWHLSLTAALAGLSGGSKAVLTSILCKATMAGEYYDSAVSLTLFISGIGEPTGEAFMGFLYDETSSYGSGFLLIAAIDVLSAIVIMMPLIKEYIMPDAERSVMIKTK